MGYVNKVQVGNDAHLIEPTLYCECSTAAATAAKTATLNGFELQTGVQVTVKFTVTNTADNPTLSINGSTAKAIYYQGSAINKDFLIAGQTYNFIYNGEQWDLISDPTKFSIGDTLSITNGGTGRTSLTENAILLGNGTSAIKASSISIGTSSYTDYIIFKIPIYNSTTTGGWARRIATARDANNVDFFRAGYFGYNSSSTSTLHYFYMGPNDYDSVSNFRIYPDGGIYAPEIKPYSITSLSNLNSKSGTYFFASSSTFVISDISANSNDWVGLQVGNANYKWQLTASNNHLWLRQNDTGGTDTANWSSWYRLIDSSITISGDVSATLNGNTFITSIGEGKVTNAMLANSSITIADNTLSLGDTLTATDLRTSLSLSAALRFIGVVASDSAYTPSDGGTGAPTITGVTSYTPIVGDVILDSNSDAEYVCSSVSGTTYTWELLGRDGSWALSTHTHGNITNDGKLATANRMIWTDSSKNIYASSHYVDSTHVAINSTSQPSNAFYVNGGSYFTDHISLGSEKRIIFKTNRKYEGTESIGWTFPLLTVLGKNDTTPFFCIGVYGGRNALNYAYFGGADYASNNLRVYSDGVVKIPVTTASTSKTTGALVVGGGIGVNGSVYATTFYGDLSGNATSATYLGNIGRQTNMDIDLGATTYNSKVFISYADGSTTTNKPPSNAMVFNIAWDNITNNHYGIQMALSNTTTPHIFLRGCNNGTWDTTWATVLDSSNYSTYAATSTHTHGNITNDGKLSTANRLVWTDSTSKIYAGYHYADSTHIAINNTTAPSKNLYVNGTTELYLNSDSSSDKKFLLTGVNAELTIGSQGIQSYNKGTTTPRVLYLQYAGSDLWIGSSTTTNAVRNFYGKFEFFTTSGFNYSGISVATTSSTNIDRPIWFGGANASGIPVIDNSFKFNPATNTLTINTGTLTATSYSGNAASASAISATLATTTKTYLLGTSTAITATAANVNLTGDTGVYLTTIAGELSAARHSWNVNGTEKAYTIYNTTDDSIDFVFI